MEPCGEPEGSPEDLCVVILPGGTGVGQGTIAMMRDTGDGGWQINFDVSSPRDQYCATQYTSALRVST